MARNVHRQMSPPPPALPTGEPYRLQDTLRTVRTLKRTHPTLALRRTSSKCILCSTVPEHVRKKTRLASPFLVVFLEPILNGTLVSVTAANKYNLHPKMVNTVAPVRNGVARFDDLRILGYSGRSQEFHLVITAHSAQRPQIAFLFNAVKVTADGPRPIRRKVPSSSSSSSPQPSLPSVQSSSSPSPSSSGRKRRRATAVVQPNGWSSVLFGKTVQHTVAHPSPPSVTPPSLLSAVAEPTLSTPPPPPPPPPQPSLQIAPRVVVTPEHSRIFDANNPVISQLLQSLLAAPTPSIASSSSYLLLPPLQPPQSSTALPVGLNFYPSTAAAQSALPLQQPPAGNFYFRHPTIAPSFDTTAINQPAILIGSTSSSLSGIEMGLGWPGSSSSSNNNNVNVVDTSLAPLFAVEQATPPPPIDYASLLSLLLAYHSLDEQQNIP